MIHSAPNVFQLIRDCDCDPTLDDFYDWVHASVLPSILATGGYVLREEYRHAAAADELPSMPLPAAAEALLPFMSQSAATGYEEAAGPAPVYDAAFFRRVRALGDLPAVKDLYDRVDSLVLPALFDHPSATEQLTAILAAAAEPDGGVLDT